MSKGWPDPLHDRGDDFWDFDNMVNEYEYEQKKQADRQQKQQQQIRRGKPPVNTPKKETSAGWIAAVVVLFAAMIVSMIFLTPFGIVLLFVFLIVLFNRR